MGIVVGIDGSSASAAALRWAAAEAALRRTTLVAVHAWLPPPDPAGDEVAPESAAVRLLTSATAGLESERLAVRGMAASALLDAARSADLLVLGRSERIGRVAAQVAAHAPCPVVLVAP